MSGAAIIQTRINELTAFVKSGNPLTAAKKKEFAAKWNLSQRMVERYYTKEVKEILNDTHRRDDMEETAKKMHGKILAAVSKLCDIANGEYKSEKIVYAHNEPKVIVCKPSIKEQLQAMKQLKEYEEIFIAIKETQEESFERMLELLQKGKR